MTRALSVAAMLLLASGSAWAQDEEVPTRFIDMGELRVRGELERPEGLSVQARRAAEFESLIDLERSFLGEIEEDAKTAP